MEQELFRREVVTAQRGQWLGNISLATPVTSRWLVALTLLITTATLIFFSTAHYTRRARVFGELRPTAGTLEINANQTGTVTRVLTNEGAVVAAGEPLVEISGEVDTPSVGGTHAAISAELRDQQSHLRGDLVGLGQLTVEQTHQIEARIAALRLESTEIAAQVASQRAQAVSARQLCEKVKILAQSGATSLLQLKQFESDAIASEQRVTELERQQITTEQQLKSSQSELAQLPLSAAAKTNDLRDRLSAVGSTLAQNEASRNVVLQAPANGTVAALLVQPGQAVTSGQPLLSVLPSGAELQAQLLVPSSAIGLVRPGEPVVLRYQAFPYQTFGQQYGNVADISRRALSGSEIAALTGQSGSQPRYRVLVTLKEQAINVYGESQRLLPGMAVEADILLDRRTLLQWITDPAMGLGHRIHSSGGSGRP
jgi:membrane fusion protein